MTTRLPTLSKAAGQLNIGPKILFAELRRLQIIDSNNFAQRTYITKGYFRTEQRNFVAGETQREKTYYVTVVTDEGLFFLRDIANALQGTTRLHGSDGHNKATAEKEPNSVYGVVGAGLNSGIQR